MSTKFFPNDPLIAWVHFFVQKTNPQAESKKFLLSFWETFSLNFIIGTFLDDQ